MMPVQDVTLADSDDWRRVHRLDQLNREKRPIRLLFNKLAVRQGLAGFFVYFRIWESHLVKIMLGYKVDFLRRG